MRRNIYSVLYSLLPIICLSLFGIYDWHEEQARNWTEMNPLYLICFLVIGLVLAAVIFYSDRMDRKIRIMISLFWLILMPPIYVLMFAGKLAFPFDLGPTVIQHMDFAIVLESIYLFLLIHSIRNRS